MGKIKLLYDIIMTMKDKESLQGNLKVEGSKDQVRVFNLDNSFEKNMAEGRVKAKITLETDCAGKKIRHESSTEFVGADFSSCKGRGLKHHHFLHHGHQDDLKSCGIKGKLGKLAFLVGMLHSMKVEEQGDQSTLMSLDFAALPGDVKNLFQEKMQMHIAHHPHCSHGAFKEFTDMEIGNTRLAIYVNKDKEVERVLFNLEGKAKDESGAPHSMNLQAELSLSW